MKKIRADRRVGLLLGGVIVATFVAIGATVALPSADPSLEVEQQELSAEEAAGMEVFRAEGCWYCHTQYVRETVVDRDAFGRAASGPGEFAITGPAMLGVERAGSDLSEIAITPEQLREHGSVGSLSYLSADDLAALTAYLLAARDG